MRLGYARVSTGDQSLEGQYGRLSATGCDELFEEKISGATRNRPQLELIENEARLADVVANHDRPDLAQLGYATDCTGSASRWTTVAYPMAST